MGSLVRRDDFDGWTRLTLNRPDKLNALTVGMFTELRHHVGDLKKNADEAVRIGLAEYVVPRDSLDADVEALVQRVIANSAFSHRANKRLLEATDAGPLDAGLQWEVMETEGVGPDMAERIAVFAGKRG